MEAPLDTAFGEIHTDHGPVKMEYAVHSSVTNPHEGEGGKRLIDGHFRVNEGSQPPEGGIARLPCRRWHLRYRGNTPPQRGVPRLVQTSKEHTRTAHGYRFDTDKSQNKNSIVQDRG